jgi:hypothetical protein
MGSLGVPPRTDEAAAGADELGSAVAGGGGAATVVGGATGLTGSPGTNPPDHIRVLAGAAGLGRGATAAATTMALPQAWQRITG